MTMHPHDHVLRYRFESEARPDIAHIVDLGEFNGFGECSCEDFQYRVLPVLVRQSTGETPKRCKHLLAAREDLLNKLISRISES